MLSFNRNIVECKGIPLTAFEKESPGFNRNIVECKDEFMTAVSVKERMF